MVVQVPEVRLALDCSENDRAAWLVQQVRRLDHAFLFEMQQGRFTSARWRSWLVVIAIDCTPGVAVKAGVVTGKRDEVCHFCECFIAVRVLTHSLTVAAN